MAEQEQRGAGEIELLRYIVEEVDAARDTLELVQQFTAFLPIRSHDDLIRLAGEKRTVSFRGSEFSLQAFASLVPSIVFPIESVQQLVALAAHAVELIPGTAGNDLSNPETARRLMRRASLRSITPGGRLGPAMDSAGFGSGLPGGMRPGVRGESPSSPLTSEEGQ